jgi:DNA polymerase-3 subunit alpha
MYDVEEKLKLNMPSRTQKVEISKELLEELKEMELKYKLN